MNRLGAETVLAATLLFSGATFTAAQGPGAPPPPVTFWNKLGIPQGYQKFKDARINKRGNHPNWERKPKLKRIADPANLESKNKAIQKAAEIKSEEDLAPQKIKGIKYLASIGCGCYNRDGGITDALLAAMDDCTEEVRLAAVEAISDAGECEQCVYCKERTCCTQAIAKRLEKMAFEQDEKGCWFEPSERVRNAAAAASQICSPKLEPKPVAPEPEPVPEIPGDEGPRPEIPSDLPPSPPDAAKRPLHDLVDSDALDTPTALPRRVAAKKVARSADVKTESPSDPPARVLIDNPPSQMPRPIRPSAETKATKMPSSQQTTSSQEPAAAAETSVWISDDKPSAVQKNFAAPPLAGGSSPTAIAPARHSTVKLAEQPASELPANEPVSGAAFVMSEKMASTSSKNKKPLAIEPAAIDPPATTARAIDMPIASPAPIGGKIVGIDRGGDTLRIRLNAGSIAPVGTRYQVSRDYLLGAAVLGQVEVTHSEPGIAIAQPVGDLHAAQIEMTDAISLINSKPR